MDKGDNFIALRDLWRETNMGRLLLNDMLKNRIDVEEAVVLIQGLKKGRTRHCSLVLRHVWEVD